MLRKRAWDVGESTKDRGGAVLCMKRVYKEWRRLNGQDFHSAFEPRWAAEARRHVYSGVEAELVWREC